ncbi:MAG: hypothetical protein IJ514_05480 [Clostridia bacterium]|nr:hypothetical protein [Clostridia bacterium]
MRYTIESTALRVTVESYGAELVSVLHRGKERLWQNETGEWAGHAPLLFPVCGHFGITHKGKTYDIAAHGFAKRTEFTLAKQSENSLTFTIRANAATKEAYPFDFVFSVTYAVEGDKLSVLYAVENPSSEPLYFACGGHESFALEDDVDEYELVFEKEENLLHYHTDESGYLTGETYDYGTATVFPLPVDFLQEGRTLIFKDVRSRKITLRTRKGEEKATVSFEVCGNLLLWRAGSGKFICIEPWTNLPDLAGVADTEFSEKEGVVEVAPQSVKTVARTVEYK